MTFLPRWFSGAGQKSSVFDFCNIFVGNKFAFETDSNSHSHSDLVSDSDSVNEILKHTETDGCVGRWMLCCYIRPLEFKIQITIILCEIWLNSYFPNRFQKMCTTFIHFINS